MRRRDISKALLATAAGSAVVARQADAQTCTAPCYAQTAIESAAGVTPSNYAYPPGNVLRYGADSTGTYDSTYAFQQATFSIYSGWAAPTSGVLYTVTIPPGRYRFAGVNTPYGTPSVFVRGGMALIGSGMGGTYLDLSAWGAVATNAIYLGWGFISGTATQDPGGQGPEFSECFVLGGPSGGGASVYAHFNGGEIHDVWFSSCGLAVYQAGFDIYDCIFDIGLVAISKGSDTEAFISGCTFFNPNYCISFDGSAPTGCSDLVISHCQFNYPRFAAISIGSGGTAKFSNIRFSDCSFIMNAQYTTFAGYLYLASSSTTQLEFNHCTFRNMYGAALQIVSAGAVVDCNGCLFDGSPSNYQYTASTTSSAVSIESGTLRLTSCQYRNMAAVNAVVMAGSAQVVLRLNGVQYSGNNASGSFINIYNSNPSSSFFIKDVDGDGVQVLLNAQSTVPVKWKNLNNWWGEVQSSGAYNYVFLPYQQSSLYQVTLSANGNAAGNPNYSKSISVYVGKMNDYGSSGATSYITQNTVYADPAGLSGIGQLALTALFGGVPGTTGSGTSVAQSASGQMYVAWSNAYTQVSLDIQPSGGGVS